MAAAWALLLLASVALSGAQAKEIAVDWTLQPGGANYEPISANVGDTLVFTYAAFHDVWTLPADACDFSAAGASQLAATDASPFSYTLDTAGDFYFGCNIASHCASGGMLLEVKVAEGGASGTPSPEAPPPSEMFTFASLDPSLSTLDQVAGMAGITDYSSLLANVTLLAPNNDAFNALLASPPPALAALATNPSDPAAQEVLTQILLGHVIPGLVFSSDLTDGEEILTAANTTLTVKIDGGTVTFEGPANSANVVTPDLETPSGSAIIHVIDAVLLPTP